METTLTRSSQIGDFPRFLTIVLKRFTHGNWISNKISKYVHYPMELHINDHEVYSLIALITHSGLLAYRGHYRAIVRLDGDWVEFDDHKTKLLDESGVMGKEAYLLLYERLIR